MANVENHELVSTFLCGRTIPQVPGTDAEIILSVINFSDLNQRHRITSFVTVFSQETETISVFTRRDEQRDREELVASISYIGIQLREHPCARFHMSDSRLLCHLAGSAAEASYFTMGFPLRRIRARGNFVRARSNSRQTRAVKITFLDSRIDALEPRRGQSIHRFHEIRLALLKQIRNRNIAPGTLFVTVTSEELGRVYTRETVDTYVGSLRIPRSLAAMFRRNYPDGAYPPHVVNLMNYLDMINLRNENLTQTDVDYVEDLEAYSIGQVMDVLIYGIDILKQRVLADIFRLLAEKIDELGNVSVNELSQSLNFIIIQD